MNTNTVEHQAVALAERRAAIAQAIADLQAAALRATVADIDAGINAARQALDWGQQ